MAEPTFPDLRAFLDQLRRDGDLVTVEAPVDAHLEAAEIHRRVIAAGGPALLFTNVRGARFPARHQPLRHGAPGRAGVRHPAAAAHPAARASSPRRCCRPRRPSSGARATSAREALRIGSKRRGSGPVAEVVTADVRLDRLPVLTTWPEDGGPFVTLPLVYTEHPDGKGHNLGMYRLHVHDARTTGMHWQIGKGGGFTTRSPRRAGRRCRSPSSSAARPR